MKENEKERVAVFMDQERNRRYHSREEMERARQIRRRRAIKRRLRLKRRIYFCLFIVGILLAVVLLFKWKKSGDTLSGNSVSADTAQQEKQTVSEETAGIPSSQLPVEEERFDTVSSSLLDVTCGTAVVDFTSVSENRAGMVEKAKQAMEGQAHFTGSNLTVNEALTSYGAGEWHALFNKQEDLCVFYTGERDGVRFRVNFELYDDGSFILVSASRGGVEIEDYAGFVTSIVSR